MRKTLFLIIIFASAFLLFQVQPILTKTLLPSFGGSASVWSASLVFYQGTLFCGYLYAYLLTQLHLHYQFAIHIFLLIIASFITLPEMTIVNYSAEPALNVILTLIGQIGMGFLLLSATSVLMQYWYFATTNSQVPYQWYSLSNLGSLFALLSYPFFIEVSWSLTTQKQHWLQLFFVVVAFKLLLVILQTASSNKTSLPAASKQPLKESKANVFLCLLLSATSSILLIATTQMITTNIPPMPLLWVLPLSIYLISYIFTFSSKYSYQRSHWLPFLLFALPAGLMMHFIGSWFNALVQLSLFSVILLIGCVICHGELRQRAPEHNTPTRFYLSIAGGSVLGSLFASLAAPVLFDRIHEYIIALFLVALLYVFIRVPKATNKLAARHKLGWSFGLVMLFFSFIGLEHKFTQYDIASERNFYGYLAVKDITTADIAERRLIDGTTVHGSEPLTASSYNQGSYYQRDSGVGQSLANINRQTPLNIGVIGLGAGVLASFNREQDKMSFFELNPAVYDMAANHFSYLKQAKGKVEVQIADGRLALKQRLVEDKNQFDVLIIDAFSSDVIPSHLLTREAFELYWQNISPDGLLLLHISNNHIDLTPVLKGHSEHFDKTLLKFVKQATSSTQLASHWVALTSDQSFVAATNGEVIASNSTDEAIAWTDEKYSLLTLFKY